MKVFSMWNLDRARKICHFLIKLKKDLNLIKILATMYPKKKKMKILLSRKKTKIKSI